MSGASVPYARRVTVDVEYADGTSARMVLTGKYIELAVDVYWSGSGLGDVALGFKSVELIKEVRP